MKHAPRHAAPTVGRHRRPTHTPRHAKRPGRWRALLILVGIGVFTLSGCGQTAAPEASGSTPTVTVTAVPKPKATVTKEVKVTPDSCLLALDLADEGFGYAADALNAASDGFTAIGNFDLDAMDAASSDMNAATSKISRISDKYNSAKAKCRAAR